jgi:hypothetical protein
MIRNSIAREVVFAVESIIVARKSHTTDGNSHTTLTPTKRDANRIHPTERKNLRRSVQCMYKLLCATCCCFESSACTELGMYGLSYSFLRSCATLASVIL